MHFAPRDVYLHWKTRVTYLNKQCGLKTLLGPATHRWCYSSPPICSQPRPGLLSESHESNLQTTIFLITWWIVSFLGIILMIEPAHLIQVQMDRTYILVCQLENRFTDPEISFELAKFSLHVTLNKASFKPMGICKLSRSLLLTVLGVYSTYLVLIIQLQSK
ncbi:hypothetical protein evm_001380 [Chilo suppressalis]|nr:hypothetical protein evm_001380 [Chilo suppressalis]